MLDKIIDWANGEDAIRSLILVGSRVIRGASDALSDYDISVFCTSPTPFTESDRWQSRMGDVWICLPLSISYNDQEYPTRLIIYEPGIKVDLTFYAMDVLEELIGTNRLPPMYDAGYEVLLDKGGHTQGMPKPTRCFTQCPPSEKEFCDLVEEFWFEAYHVAKYLKRGDLWSVKFRMNGIYDLLLKMIEWNEQAKHEWNYPTQHLGKKMQTWVDPSTWGALQSCFAHFDQKDIQNALTATLTLFSQLGQETAGLLQYRYPNDVEKSLNGFIQETMGEGS